jgi:hypothetical protein
MRYFLMLSISTHFCTESKVITQVADMMFHKIHETLIEAVILTLHVSILDKNPQDVLVE